MVNITQMIDDLSSQKVKWSFKDYNGSDSMVSIYDHSNKKNTRSTHLKRKCRQINTTTDEDAARLVSDLDKEVANDE